MPIWVVCVFIGLWFLYIISNHRGKHYDRKLHKLKFQNKTTELHNKIRWIIEDHIAISENSNMVVDKILELITEKREQ